jgi:hypothetical protein
MPVHSIGRYNIGSMAKYGGFKGRSFAKLQNQVNNLPTTGSECLMTYWKVIASMALRFTLASTVRSAGNQSIGR